MRPAEVPLSADCRRPIKTEIRKAIKLSKNSKAPGPDKILAEALKAAPRNFSPYRLDAELPITAVVNNFAEYNMTGLVGSGRKTCPGNCRYPRKVT